MNILNQTPLTLHPDREAPVRKGIYPQAGPRKSALWRRRDQAHKAVEKLFFAAEASVASALNRLVVKSTPTDATRLLLTGEDAGYDIHRI